MALGHDGYVNDLPYTSNAFVGLSPVNLRLPALVAGVDVAPFERGGVMWELGCGYGNGLISAAAAYPECQFVGVDFNPAHIAGGRRRIATLGLTNIELLEADFAELAARPGSLPPCDLAVIHGVYSWVGAPVRAALQDLLRQGVRSGGLVFLSYNVLPGSQDMAVFQRALLEASRLSVGRSDVRLEAAKDRIKALRAAGAGQLVRDGLMKELFEKIESAPTAYLVHEYMNESWDALYHSQVAADMAAARLDYAGSAVPHENFPNAMLTPAQLEALEDIALPAVRETLRDMFLQRILRRDLYMRGLTRMSGAGREEVLRDQLFCAASRQDGNPVTLNWPAGEVEVPAPYLQAGQVLWRDGPTSLRALLDGPLAGSGSSAAEAVAILVSSGLAWPCLPPPSSEVSAVVQRAVFDLAERACRLGLGESGAVPAPRVGSELPVGGLEARVLDGLWQGVPNDTPALVEHVWAPFEAAGEWLVHKGERIEDGAQCRAVLTEMLDRLRPERIPLWRGLGMLPPEGTVPAGSGGTPRP
ncbi:methyltransferase domain-containing protein [Roseospira marina]|uniref:Methyltransferase domain-containing protein n=1 Tax=Roseospira marina TaxID=140057 RepID=A0A5M6IGA4_9PROT|nr:class I SAM-dependent methyltransferase [Roseospira marina]KAA5606917.1 methyltransferase domain-containing protein [Roseospira marina]MBB4312912.1 SAM-dependent methyltransferase [Roseospira marina]MBB5086315.1 SAM-dependent methyltransferase [Roseospira marina]